MLSHDTVINEEDAVHVLELIYELSNMLMSEKLKNLLERYLSAKHQSFRRHGRKTNSHEDGCLYNRVSTNEQAEKGYSLRSQVSPIGNCV